jgi:hypothetical protein
VGYRINHIHLEASDPRKTADRYVKAFDFTIVSDSTRVFGDRFIRCQSADGGIAFLRVPGDCRVELVQPAQIAGGSGDCCA